MTRQGAHHPIQVAIDDVYAAEHTPRLQIDARRSDVEVPDSVRRTWQARLVIDLDPSYPLELEYDEQGVSVDLAFQGQVTRCRFGWGAIYAVIDRSTGRGIVVEAHLPAPELAPELVWVEQKKKPRLSAVPPRALRAETPSSSRVPAITPEVEGAAKQSVTQDEAPSALPGSLSGSLSSSEQAAKERRARFRVIDGGR